jgi:GGDEF domain-containing protein
VKKSGITIKMILELTLFFMGIVGLILALVSSSLYHSMTLGSQQQALQELVQLKVEARLSDMELESRNQGSALLNSNAFRTAFEKNDHRNLNKLLQQELKDLKQQKQDLNVVNITVYSRNFQTVAEASQGLALDLPYPVCGSVLNRARLRTGLESTQIISELCLIEQHLLRTTILPLGGYSLTGYMAVVVDPLDSLIQMEKSLGLPLRFTQPDGKVHYQSEQWPRDVLLLDEGDQAELTIKTSEDENGLRIAMAHQSSNLTAELSQARLIVILVACVATLLAIVIAWWIIRRTTVIPLQRLTGQLHRVQQDENEIGRQLKVTGTSEITELTQGFNSMTKKLQSMYLKLEELAFTDALTRLPNRYQLNQRLEGFTSNQRRGHNSFGFLLMDLDRFKTINDTLGHHVGDQLLQQVSIRMQEVLRDSDVVTRLDQASRSAFEDDMVARLGGDEFAAILPDAKTRDQAETVARKLNDAMREEFVVETHQFNIGISIGIVVFPDDGDDMHTLMRKADVAMYYAKKNRLGFAYYDESQTEDVLQETKLKAS